MARIVQKKGRELNHGVQMKAQLTRPFAGHPLTRKLAVVTAIKVAGLFILWWIFFSGHGHDGITPDQVADAMLHSPASTSR